MKEDKKAIFTAAGQAQRAATFLMGFAPSGPNDGLDLWVELNNTRPTGVILCNQLRTIDIAARNGRLVEMAPDGIIDDMLARIATLVT